MKKQFQFTSEPRDTVYRRLLELATQQPATFYVVSRDQMGFNDNARRILSALEPNLISETSEKEWPGTRMLGSEARVSSYRASSSAITELQTCAAGPYDWIGPDRPEDLGFRRGDGSIWVASIAHEQDAWLDWNLMN